MKPTLIAASFAAFLMSGTAMASCQLGNGIKHVVYLQFDNTHFRRDNPNVPSDIEQMPNLLNFIEQNGMLLSNDHTQLISHTSNGLITSMTGVYSDRTGAAAISNSFDYFNSSTEIANHYSSSFVYWTNKLSADTSTGGDNSYILLSETGQNAPAPWVAYTRAGCDVGALGIADIDLENNTTDLATTYGTGSKEYALGSAHSYVGVPDFEGIALHCAQGSAVCAAANALASGAAESDGLPVSKAVTDVLPDEPNGYTGFQGIFGHRYVVPALQSLLGQATNGQLTDYQGNLIGYQTASNGTIVQSETDSGFPGFDGMFPFVTLSYAETMLKAGVPVIYGYFSDAHDHHYATQDGVNPAGTAFAYGPGQQGYTNQLKQYDAAWGTFFQHLAAAGIDKTNTLFVVLVEEGDKFAGGLPSPAGCDGVTTACNYPPSPYTNGRPAIGEVDINIDQLLAAQRNDTTPLNVHTDQAPAFYLNTNPAQTAALTRTFERDLAATTYNNPYLQNKVFPTTNYLADQAEMSLLHMVTADPLRTPTLVAFNDAYVYSGVGAVTSGTSNPSCDNQIVCTYGGFAWNHGGTSDYVKHTWTSMVGPGIKAVGNDTNTWTDHTDVRATMFALLGLQDDYAHDGRVVAENINTAALPADIASNLQAYLDTAKVYKQLTAPFGAAAFASLTYATNAIASNTPNDATYSSYLANMSSFVSARNTLAGQIRTVLNNAEQNKGFDAHASAGLNRQAAAMIRQMQGYAGTGTSAE